MTLHDNSYAAFMLDYAAGVLAPAERLAADLHRVLSREGGRNARLLDAVGGAMLERSQPIQTDGLNTARPSHPDAPAPEADSRLDPFLKSDLLALKWRRDIWGVKTAPTTTRMASLLRLDPGEVAPGHGHGRRDITVVLRGAYADEFGVYERGDLAFAEPGMKHRPRAVGDETCVCLLATEAGRPVSGFIGLFGIGPGKQRSKF